jgi:uncharacterized protein (DUF1697 family)
MTTNIALLRAVNLPGHNKVSMDGLRALVERAGMKNVRTLLNSGNIVFQSASASAAKLEAALEAEAARELGVATDFFVRSAKEWQGIIAANPFPREAKNAPGLLVVMTLKAAPPQGAVDALQQAIKGREVVRANGRDAYITYPDGQGRSKLTIAIIEKHLGTHGTARNWNTVLKLGAMACAE